MVGISTSTVNTLHKFWHSTIGYRDKHHMEINYQDIKDPILKMVVKARQQKESSFSKETRKRLEKLQKYQYPQEAIEKLKRRFPFNKMSDQDIQECIVEFKKFIALLLINRYEKGNGDDYSHTPTEKNKIKIAMTNELVDEVWHNLILFTKDYHIFSDGVFGQYLHHSPSTVAVPLTPESIRSFYGE